MTAPMTAARLTEVRRLLATIWAEDVGQAADDLLAENARLAEDLDGANGCLSMVRDFLKGAGCECSAATHDATPPSCYPSWIACAMRAYAAKALREGGAA